MEWDRISRLFMLILRGPFYCPYHSSLEGLGHSSLLGNTYTCTVLESLLSISPMQFTWTWKYACACTCTHTHTCTAINQAPFSSAYMLVFKAHQYASYFKGLHEGLWSGKQLGKKPKMKLALAFYSSWLFPLHKFTVWTLQLVSHINLATSYVKIPAPDI